MFESVRAKRSHAGQADLQMTPLIDMVFILLIFFMVTTQFVSDTGLRVERPSAAAVESLAPERIAVAMNAQGQITVDGQRMGLLSIRPWIQRALRRRPGLAAVIMADKAIALERVVQVMDEVRAAGVTQVAIGTVAKDGFHGR